MYIGLWTKHKLVPIPTNWMIGFYHHDQQIGIELKDFEAGTWIGISGSLDQSELINSTNSLLIQLFILEVKFKTYHN